MRISDWSSDVCSSDLTPAASRMRPSWTPVHCPIALHPSTQSWRVICVRCGIARMSAIDSDSGRATRPETLTRQSTNPRSEEHTSELQSLMRISYADFCLKNKQLQNSKDSRTTE